MNARELSKSQAKCVAGNLAFDRELLARPEWLAADARREPALRERVERYEQELSRAGMTLEDVAAAVLTAKGGLGQ